MTNQDHAYIEIPLTDAEPIMEDNMGWKLSCMMYTGLFAICIAIILLAYFLWH
jgi:hypothetical protein